MLEVPGKQNPANQLERLTQWSQSYQRDFVAHGIVSNNVAAVLADGRLRCAENILRHLGSLEFEGGATNGSREIVRLPNNVQNVFTQDMLEEIKSAVLEWFDLTDDHIEKLLLYYNDGNKKKRSIASCPDAVQALRRLPLRKKDPDTSSYPFSAGREISSALNEAGSAFECWIKKIIEENPSLWVEEDKPRYLYQAPLFAIYMDKLLPKEQRCKALLQRMYKIYQRLVSEKAIDMSMVEMGEIFDNYRKHRLADPYKISGTIRVYKNSVNDCYGRVRILIGGTQPIIGSEQQKDTGEHYLLSAGQNGGQFFKVDLSKPNVLIIGPREVLSQYVNDARLGKNILFIENMPKAWP